MLDSRAVMQGKRLPLEIFRALAESVVRQAVIDLHNDAYRDDARRFFEGRSFDAYCDILGWNPGRARQNLNARLEDLMHRASALPTRHPAATAR